MLSIMVVGVVTAQFSCGFQNYAYSVKKWSPTIVANCHSKVHLSFQTTEAINY